MGKLMKQLLKYKAEEKVVVKSNKTDFLKRESVRMNSVADIDLETGFIMTVGKTRGKIYQFSFKVPIGLSPQIDDENKRLLTNLLNSCNGKLKIWLLNEHKGYLHENMEMLKGKIQQEDENNSVSDVYVNRYVIMQTMEKMIYATGYIFVEEGIYRFEEIAQSFLNLYMLNGEDLLLFIERLNNDPLGGDEFVFE